MIDEARFIVEKYIILNFQANIFFLMTGGFFFIIIIDNYVLFHMYQIQENKVLK